MVAADVIGAEPARPGSPVTACDFAFIRCICFLLEMCDLDDGKIGVPQPSLYFLQTYACDGLENGFVLELPKSSVRKAARHAKLFDDVDCADGLCLVLLDELKGSADKMPSWRDGAGRLAFADAADLAERRFRPFPLSEHAVENLRGMISFLLAVGTYAGKRWMGVFAEDVVINSKQNHLVRNVDFRRAGAFQYLDRAVVPCRGL